jgi:hypothetical protein
VRLTLLILFFVTNLGAKEIIYHKITKSNKIIISRTQDMKVGSKISIYVYNRYKAKGLITKCIKNKCLLKITKKAKSFTLSHDVFKYSTVRFKLKIPKTPKVSAKVEEEKTIEKKPKQKKPQKNKKPIKKEATEKKEEKKDKNKKAIIGYGGPFGGSFMAGLDYKINENVELRILGGYTTSTIGSVVVTGFGAQAGATYNLFNVGDLIFLATFEMAFYSLTLDLVGIDPAAPIVTDTSFSFIFGGEMEYQISDKYRFHILAGFATNSLPEFYEDGGNRYTITFKGGVPIIGLYLSFNY